MDGSSKLPKLDSTDNPSPVTFSASTEKTSESTDMPEVTSVMGNEKSKGLEFLKFRLRLTKRILPVIFIGLGVAILTLIGVVAYLYVKESAVKIKDIRITNISDGSATVSWVSDRKSKGVVYYGEKDNWTPIFTFAGKEREDDDRDVEFDKDGNEVLLDGGRKEYYTHHVTIEGLNPNTRYFYRIGTGVIKGFNKDVDGNEVKPIETAPVIESLSTPNPAYGRVFKFDGSAVEDGIVFYHIVKDGGRLSSTLSTTVSDGTWSVDLSNARDLTLSERMILTEDQTHVLEFDTADGSASVDISKLQYQPVNDVILNSDQGNGSYEDKAVKERFAAESSSGFQTTLVSSVYACEEKGYNECCGPAKSRHVEQKCDQNGNNYWEVTSACSGDSNCPGGESGSDGGQSQECKSGEQYNAQTGNCDCVAPGGCRGSGGGGTGGSGGGTGGGQTGGGEIVADTAGTDSNCQITEATCNNKYCSSSYTPKYNACEKYPGYGNCQCLTNGTGGGGASANAEGADGSCKGQCKGDPPGTHYGEGTYCDGVDNVPYICKDGVFSKANSTQSGGTSTAPKEVDPIFCSGAGTNTCPLGYKCSSTTAVEGVCECTTTNCQASDVNVPVTCAQSGQIPAESNDKKCCPGLDIGASGLCYKPVSQSGEDQGGSNSFCDTVTDPVKHAKCLACQGNYQCENAVVNNSGAGLCGAPGQYPCCSGTLVVCSSTTPQCIDSAGNKKCMSPEANSSSEADNNSIVSTVLQENVLGASTVPYEIKVNESGSYLLTSDALEGGVREVKVFVPDGGQGKIRFFSDKNANGIKDEGEEFIAEDLGISIEQKESSQRYTLEAGWNLIGFTLFPTSGQGRTAKSILTALNKVGGFVTHVATYRDGQFLIYSQRNGIEFGNDFNILPGEAYFIRSYSKQYFTISGNKFTEGVPLDLSNGWNLVSIIKPNSTLTAGAVLDSMIAQGINSDALSRYQSGLYTSIIKQNGELFGRDFNIVQTSGYFVRVKDGGGKRWTP